MAAIPFLRQWFRLKLLNGVLYRMYRRRAGEDERLQIVVPASLVPGVLTSIHAGPAGGHFDLVQCGRSSLLTQSGSTCRPVLQIPETLEGCYSAQ